MMSDKDFLNWLADRLVFFYGESENVDFVLRVRELAGEIERLHNYNDYLLGMVKMLQGDGLLIPEGGT